MNPLKIPRQKVTLDQIITKSTGFSLFMLTDEGRATIERKVLGFFPMVINNDDLLICMSNSDYNQEFKVFRSNNTDEIVTLSW